MSRDYRGDAVDNVSDIPSACGTTPDVPEVPTSLVPQMRSVKGRDGIHNRCAQQKVLVAGRRASASTGTILLDDESTHDRGRSKAPGLQQSPCPDGSYEHTDKAGAQLEDQARSKDGNARNGRTRRLKPRNALHPPNILRRSFVVIIIISAFFRLYTDTNLEIVMQDRVSSWLSRFGATTVAYPGFEGLLQSCMLLEYPKHQLDAALSGRAFPQPAAFLHRYQSIVALRAQKPPLLADDDLLAQLIDIEDHLLLALTILLDSSFAVLMRNFAAVMEEHDRILLLKSSRLLSRLSPIVAKANRIASMTSESLLIVPPLSWWMESELANALSRGTRMIQEEFMRPLDHRERLVQSAAEELSASPVWQRLQGEVSHLKIGLRTSASSYSSHQRPSGGFDEEGRKEAGHSTIAQSRQVIVATHEWMIFVENAAAGLKRTRRNEQTEHTTTEQQLSRCDTLLGMNALGCCYLQLERWYEDTTCAMNG
ncbi:hypothetical protein Slin14017_G128610 [Septoria linicola]|nr:hypothetical protein Slin14017_G128610 [Septoria linicola]